MRKGLLFVVFPLLVCSIFSCRKNAISSFQNSNEPVFISIKKPTTLESSLNIIEGKKDFSLPDSLIQFSVESKIDTIVPEQSNSFKQKTEAAKKTVKKYKKEPRNLEQDINNSKVSMWLAITSFLLPFIGLFFSSLSINLYVVTILLGLVSFILGFITIGKVKDKLFSILGIAFSWVTIIMSIYLILITLLVQSFS